MSNDAMLFAISISSLPSAPSLGASRRNPAPTFLKARRRPSSSRCAAAATTSIGSRPATRRGLAHRHAHDAEHGRSHTSGSGCGGDRISDQELPGTATSRSRRHRRPGESRGQSVPGADAWIAAARPACRGRRSDLVDRPDASKLGRVDPRTGRSRSIRSGPHPARTVSPRTRAGISGSLATMPAISASSIRRPATLPSTSCPTPRRRIRIRSFSIATGRSGSRCSKPTWWAGSIRKSGEIKLVTPPTPRSRPYGMAVKSRNVVFFVEFGTNKVASIDARQCRSRSTRCRTGCAAAAYRHRP